MNPLRKFGQYFFPPTEFIQGALRLVSWQTIFTILFSLISVAAISQENQIKTRDSLQVELLSVHSRQLREMEAVRISDSLQRADLDKQISALKANEKSKRQELMKQIAAMNARDSLRVARLKLRIDSLKLVAKGFPVALPPNDTLFYIFNKVGSFSPLERARAVSQRIKTLADELLFNADSLKLVPTEQSVDIMYGEIILISITELDALWMHSNEEKLASDYKKVIGDSIIAYQKETSMKTILIKVALALLVVAVLIAIIMLISWIFRWTKRKLESQTGKLIKGIKIKDYELFDIPMEMKILVILNTMTKWLLVLLAVYISLPVLFGLFPWTKNFATILLAYFLDPLKAILKACWDYLPNLFTIIVIMIVFRFVLKGVRYIKYEIEKEVLRIPGFFPDLANPTYQIIRALIFAFMLVVIFPFLPGSKSPVFQGVSVFLGILFTFGSSGSLSNLIAGLVITYMRSFKVGDRVKIGDITGDIIEKAMLVTRVRTIKNEIISIPNSSILGSHLINYSSDARDRGLIIYTTITIGYDASWRQVHQLMIDAALATEFVEKEPLPFVLQTSLEDFYVSYQINAYTREPNLQATIYSQLHQNIQDKFNEAGVEIMSPHYKAHRDGNTTTIPPDYLPKDYKAPSFRISETEK
ncbi:MAG: mechanosensitive ion channel family protein [Bacteroidota bacterium]